MENCRRSSTRICSALLMFAWATSAGRVLGATILVPEDHATIQAAVTAANPGDVIEVGPGEYYGEVTLNKSGLTLRGSGMDETTIDAQGANHGILIPATAHSVLVENLAVTAGVERGVKSFGPDFVIQGCRVYQNFAGIHIFNSSGTVDGCVVERNVEFGIHCTGTNCDALIASNDVLDNGGRGIWTNAGSIPTICDNLVAYNDQVGINCDSGSSATIEGNIIAYNSATGILLWSGTTKEIRDNMFVGNQLWGLVCLADFGPDESPDVPEDDVATRPRVEGNVFDGNVLGGIQMLDDRTQNWDSLNEDNFFFGASKRIEQRWRWLIRVVEPDGSPAEGAAVTLSDASGAHLRSGATSSTGFFPKEPGSDARNWPTLTEYVVNSDGATVYNTPHHISALLGDLHRTVFFTWDGEDNDGASGTTTNNRYQIAVVRLSLIEVDVDIKPGDSQNRVNSRSQGVMPVAIFTMHDFDAAVIDGSTVDLVGVAAEQFALEDVDGDGDLDMILYFRTQEVLDVLDLDLESGDSVTVDVELTGETIDQVMIQGVDSINFFITGKGKGKTK